MKTKTLQQIIISLIVSFSFFSCAPVEKKASEIAQKEALSAGFPRILFFRGDKSASDKDYKYWESEHLQYNGVTKKYLTEEVDMPPHVAEYANQFALEHPEKLMLLHLNGEQIVNKRKEVHENYFPGHWIYEEGTILLEDIHATDTVLQLASALSFKEEAYIIRGGGQISKRPHDILIVKLDEQGDRLWNESEYATVKAVDYENNTITVERERYFSTASSFEGGSTQVAPIAGNGWGGNLLWYYNLSTACPKDKNGMKASDVFLEQIVNWFDKENGELREFDGIGFDVCYFSATHHEKWDTDNDGLADAGIIDGKNIWRIENWNFMQDLRNSFGSEFIITADGWSDEMQRAVGALNGMESEGLCAYNDGFRQISRTLNQHTYWNLHNSTKYKFSYITSKLRNPVDSEISTQLRRMGLGVACGLGVAYTSGRQPEVHAGELNKNNWMGLPVSELIYTAKNTPDLFEGSGISMESEFIEQFNLEDTDYKVEDNTLYIRGKNKNPYADMSLDGPEIRLSEGEDLIVFFEAKAIEGYYDLEEPNRVPRKINIKVNGEPLSTLPGETNQDIAMHNNLAGFIGTPGFTPLNFYFRNIGRGEDPVKITLEVEEQGEFAIRNFSAHAAPCTMIREFENALVLINPSYENHSFDLVKLFPDINNLKRIKAVDNDQDDSEYNNGEIIYELSSVEVPGLNALFLIKADK